MKKKKYLFQLILFSLTTFFIFCSNNKVLTHKIKKSIVQAVTEMKPDFTYEILE